MPRRKTEQSGIDAIAERLRLTRQALGLKQAAISRLTGISTQAWNNYETAKYRISVDQALMVCRATGVSLDWIYRGDMHGLPLRIATEIQQLISKPRAPKRRSSLRS
jgi:transcriptional regulator with XRE-family HTH domain